MLRFKKEAGDRPTVYSATIRSSDDAEITSALSEFWARLLKEIDRACEADQWQAIVCQLTVDSGRVFAYPARHGDYEWANAKVALDLSVAEVEKQYYDLPDPDDNEAKFERGYEKLYKKLRTLMKNATSDEGLTARFKELKKQKSFGVFTANAPEVMDAEVLDYLFGNRLPKTVTVQDSQELFLMLYRKAAHGDSFAPGEVKNGKLVKVHFFGGDVNDKVMAMLDDVPNLEELCNDLKEIVLEATRVRPARIEKLRHMLPKVKITVISSEEWMEKALRE